MSSELSIMSENKYKTISIGTSGGKNKKISVVFKKEKE